jgi:hypothetical protein
MFDIQVFQKFYCNVTPNQLFTLWTGRHRFDFRYDIILYPGRIPPFDRVDKGIVNQDAEMQMVTARKPGAPGATQYIAF